MSFDRSRLIKGIVAGFAATVVLTLIMMMKNLMGVMPELDPVHMLADMIAQNMNMKPNLAIGWVMHFMIGSVAWGGAFAVLNDKLPGNTQVKRGIVLGIVAWGAMMLAPMPMSGAGLFGLKLGLMAPVMTFMLHIVFGFVLGSTYSKLIAPDDS